MPHVITKFYDRFRFLSNFYGCEVWFEGEQYRSVEHAYQAAKTLNATTRRWIQEAPTAAVAKRRGNNRSRVQMRSNWDVIKSSIMLELLESKFDDPALRARLVRTFPHRLVEGNTWGDTYWGIDVRTGEGENMLGKLLEIVREGIITNRPPAKNFGPIRRMKWAESRQRRRINERARTPMVVRKIPKLPPIDYTQYAAWKRKNKENKK